MLWAALYVRANDLAPRSRNVINVDPTPFGPDPVPVLAPEEIPVLSSVSPSPRPSISYDYTLTPHRNASPPTPHSGSPTEVASTSFSGTSASTTINSSTSGTSTSLGPLRCRQIIDLSVSDDEDDKAIMSVNFAEIRKRRAERERLEREDREREIREEAAKFTIQPVETRKAIWGHFYMVCLLISYCYTHT
jgi:hypothetical protein